MVLEGFNHTKILMTRVALRAITASALAVLLTTFAWAALDPALAQETEGPFGLFDRIFGGSERVGGGGAEITT